ncbi:MAG TPA: hypothetical protein VFW65_33145 [Pseudonocardiaceae bacterium]|nr:hypothetical protein [Pseudonocardiaceae bacterium]
MREGNLVVSGEVIAQQPGDKAAHFVADCLEVPDDQLTCAVKVEHEPTSRDDRTSDGESYPLLSGVQAAASPAKLGRLVEAEVVFGEHHTLAGPGAPTDGAQAMVVLMVAEDSGGETV